MATECGNTEPAYTPREEFQCDGSTTHYQGCKCHEARRNAEVNEWRSLAEVTEVAVRTVSAQRDRFKAALKRACSCRSSRRRNVSGVPGAEGKPLWVEGYTLTQADVDSLYRILGMASYKSRKIDVLEHAIERLIEAANAVMEHYEPRPRAKRPVLDKAVGRLALAINAIDSIYGEEGYD